MAKKLTLSITTLLLGAAAAVAALLLFRRKASAQPVLASRSTGAGPAIEPPEDRPRPTGRTYTVVQGDTLSRIANRYGTSVSAIMSANPQIRDANLIRVGQVINLPPGATPGAGEGLPPITQQSADRRGYAYVRWLQQALNSVGGQRPAIAEDGTLGPQTTSALRAYQVRRGLIGDGMPGPQTEDSLIADGATRPPL